MTAGGGPGGSCPLWFALLAATAVAYLWDLSASGYADSCCAAAVQAGTKSWKAFFFGSLDSSNFITVDKSPASLWAMELSGRIFGFNSWSLLVPQALEGVAAVGLVYAAVKRWFGPAAGLVAGGVLAGTPVAALMFRFDNPDALMVLLLVAAAYAMVRALEKAGTKWIVAAGVFLGFAFLAKMLQAFTVLPAFGRGLSPGRAHPAPPPAVAARRRGGHGPRLRRMVGGDGRPVAGRVPGRWSTAPRTTASSTSSSATTASAGSSAAVGPVAVGAPGSAGRPAYSDCSTT